MISVTLGGIGIFLLGMILMTDGLKAAAGDALRSLLQRFTGGPVRALASGALVTALVQSSSATTLTTIGFVSAGLIGFREAVAVIFGANLGTTSTGWIVSSLGLKLSISAVALPLVGAGALLFLLARGRLRHVGSAIAGFGLIFVGIDFLQEGMAGFAEKVDPAAFGGDSIAGRAVLVVVGMIMTVLMQSSSAALTTTLAALDAQAITLEQGAALVIGQNLGTTVTALFATIGATCAARRTAAAHIIFNVVAGVVAFVLTSPILWLALTLGTWEDGDPGVFELTLFHTIFNFLGVLILFPFVGRFSAFVERLVPEKGPHLTRFLDPSLAEVGSLAVEAARRALVEVHHEQVASARRLVEGRPAGEVEGKLVETGVAIDAIAVFLARTHASSSHTREHRRHVGVLHALEHTRRLNHLLREGMPGRPGTPVKTEQQVHELALEALAQAGAWCEATGDPPEPDACAHLSSRIATVRRDHRGVVLEQTASGHTAPKVALAALEQIRFLDSLAYHVWRVVHHLVAADDDEVRTAEDVAQMQEDEHRTDPPSA
jgi:phosphate:Na+ symporter